MSEKWQMPGWMREVCEAMDWNIPALELAHDQGRKFVYEEVLESLHTAGLLITPKGRASMEDEWNRLRAENERLRKHLKIIRDVMSDTESAAGWDSKRIDEVLGADDE